MTTNKVAVLLATYNGEKYLAEFLESLLAQTFSCFELIVRDDGSTDKTLDIIGSYSSRLRITILDSEARLGAAKSFIQLLINSGENFDCYMFADQDDYWHCDKIHRAQASCQGDVGPLLYCAGLELVDSNLRHISYPVFPGVISLSNALVENVATGCTSALNKQGRKLVIEHLPMALTMHDWWLYIVFSALGKVNFDEYYSLKYRQHSGNTIGAATGVVHDFTRRAKRFFSRKSGGVFGISNQASEFMRCHGKQLGHADYELVNSLIDSKQSFIKRLHLALFSKFIRQKKIDTFILRLIFFLGRY